MQLVTLSRPGRLIRFGGHYCIQLERALSPTPRALYGMHELCHFWRDGVGEPCYYADDEWQPSPAEDFANLFAWFVTSPARMFVEP